MDLARDGRDAVYDALGQPDPTGLTPPQLFAGREYDIETGLYYSRLRYYDPQAGRFITRDPLGAWADPTARGNPFAYCGNSPWDMVDPFGLWAVDPINDNQAWRNQFMSGGDVRAGNLQALVPVPTPFSHAMNSFINDPCESASTKALDALQDGLDWLGLFFDGADWFNTFVSASRGNFTDAMVRGGSGIPVVGVFATTGKWAEKGEHALDDLAGIAKASKGAVELTGQVHHAISMKVWRALEEHPNLKGLYKYRDRRFETKAINKAAHNGYGEDFRALDAEVVSWIRKHTEATAEDFEEYLRDLYQRPELSAKFPNGL